MSRSAALDALIEALFQEPYDIYFDDTEEVYQVNNVDAAKEAFDSTGEGQFGLKSKDETEFFAWIMVSDGNDGAEQIIDYHTSLDYIVDPIYEKYDQ